MPLEIAGRSVGTGTPVFVVAELGLNHGGSLDRALTMVDAAARAGASAVKLQTLDAARLVNRGAPAPAHVTAASLVEFFRAFELGRREHAAVRDRARLRGLAFLSTPLHEAAVDLLESLGCDAYKIASGDITYDRLIRRAARTGKPLLVSTGMSSLTEVGDALEWARSSGARSVVLLHCVSAYPTPRGADHLAAIAHLARTFGVPVGLSDHGTEPLALPLAVALGACVYERHFSLGPAFDEIDAEVSSTASELAEAIVAAERARLAIGSVGKQCVAEEAVNRTCSRRGLYAARPLGWGHVVRLSDIAVLRPANGLAPSEWARLVGSRLRRSMTAGAAFEASDCRDADAPPASAANQGRLDHVA